MLGNRKQLNDEGFTIIEVMIVLAIAGLILLIVFLAVPALQRNSRNTQYREDASRILSGAQEFVDNNNGNLPSVAADGTTILGNANAKNITSLTIATGTTTAISPTLSAATLDTGVTCGTVGATSVTPTAGPTRSMILVYGVENSSGTVIAQCTAS